MQNKYFKNFLITIIIVVIALFIKLVINFPTTFTNFTQNTKNAIIQDKATVRASVAEIIKNYNNKNFDYLYDDLASVEFKKIYTKENFKKGMEKSYSLTGKCTSYDISEEHLNITIDFSFISDIKMYTLKIPAKFENIDNGTIFIKEIQRKNGNPQITTFSITW